MNLENQAGQIPAIDQERARKEEYFQRKYSPSNSGMSENVVSLWLRVKQAQEKIRLREIELNQQRYRG